MDDIVSTITALDARHTNLVALVGAEHRTQQHVTDAAAFDKEHPYADTRGRERHLEALDGKFLASGADTLRDVRRAGDAAAQALGHAWERAATALSESERLEQRFTPTQLTVQDRQTAHLLDETRVANFRARLSESTFRELEGWYHDAVTREDASALRFLEEQAARRFPSLRRGHPHEDAMVVGRLTSAIESARVLRVIAARPELVTARETLTKVRASVSSILALRALTPPVSFDQMRARLYARTEQATRRQREGAFLG